MLMRKPYIYVGLGDNMDWLRMDHNWNTHSRVCRTFVFLHSISGRRIINHQAEIIFDWMEGRRAVNDTYEIAGILHPTQDRKSNAISYLQSILARRKQHLNGSICGQTMSISMPPNTVSLAVMALMSAVCKSQTFALLVCCA